MRISDAVKATFLRRPVHRPPGVLCANTIGIMLLSLTLVACGGGTSSAGGAPLAANRAPTIGGSPSAQAMVATAYSFTPVAIDPDGDVLTFEILGRPAWATFDASSGTLSGTPGSTAVGPYSNIQILVSDGQAQAALPAFSITVLPATIRSATLVWQIPTRNVDGSPLTDLAGYVVRYGSDPASLDEVLSLADPRLTTIVVEELAVGTWYFTIASRNSAGVESDPTGSVFLEIR